MGLSACPDPADNWRVARVLRNVAMPLVMFWLLADAFLLRAAYLVRDARRYLETVRWSGSHVVIDFCAAGLTLAVVLVAERRRTTTLWWMPKAALIGAVAACVFVVLSPVIVEQITIG